MSKKRYCSDNYSFSILKIYSAVAFPGMVGNVRPALALFNISFTLLSSAWCWMSHQCKSRDNLRSWFDRQHWFNFRLPVCLSLKETFVLTCEGGSLFSNVWNDLKSSFSGSVTASRPSCSNDKWFKKPFQWFCSAKHNDIILYSVSPKKVPSIEIILLFFSDTLYTQSRNFLRNHFAIRKHKRF